MKKERGEERKRKKGGKIENGLSMKEKAKERELERRNVNVKGAVKGKELFDVMLAQGMGREQEVKGFAFSSFSFSIAKGCQPHTAAASGSLVSKTIRKLHGMFFHSLTRWRMRDNLLSSSSSYTLDTTGSCSCSLSLCIVKEVQHHSSYEYTRTLLANAYTLLFFFFSTLSFFILALAFRIFRSRVWSSWMT